MSAAGQHRVLRPRWVLAVAAAAFAAAALAPEVALQPISPLLVQMREPQQAVAAARIFLWDMSAFLAAAAFTWHTLITATRACVAAVAAWPPRRYWFVLVTVALAVRGWAAFALPYEPTSDALWYHEVATSLADGKGFTLDGQPTAFRSPGYPVLLAALYRMGGVHVQWAWLIGLLATAFLLAGTFSVGKQLHGEPVARAAALVAAVYPALVVMTGQALSDVVFTGGLFATLAYALRVDGSQARHAIAVGVSVGLLTWCRSVGAGLVLVIPAVWWLRGCRQTYVRAASVALLAGSLVVLPWVVRNGVVLDRLTIGTNAGSNLLTGNRPGATGWRDSFSVSPSVLAARGEVARDDAMLRDALHFVREQPAAALAIVPGKLMAMYLLETQAISSLFQGERHASDAVRRGLYVLSEMAWLAVAALVLVRIAAWRHPDARPRGREWIGWWLVAYFTAVCLVFHGEDRYRLPVLPWFLIEACLAVAGLAARRPGAASLSRAGGRSVR